MATYNKFILRDGTVFLDLSEDTITPEDLRRGVTAHNKNGEEIVGTRNTDLQEKTIIENGEFTPDGEYCGLSKVIVNVQPPLQEKTITKNSEVEADEGYYGLSKVIVDIELQDKEIDPSTTELTIVPDEGIAGLSSVVVKAIQTEEKKVTENGEVIPEEGKYLSKVTVDVQPALQSKTATPTKSMQIISPDSDYYGLKTVKVKAVSTVEADITKNGEYFTENPEELFFSKVNVNVQPKLQDDKVVTPTIDSQIISADDGYDGLSTVMVNSIPKEYIIPKLDAKTVTPSKTTQTITPDTGFDALSSVTVDPIPDEYIIPKGTAVITTNGKYNVTTTSEAYVNVQPEFNIAYGDTAPTDTSKLWIKVNEPETVEIINTPAQETNKLTYASAIMPMEMTATEAVAIGTKIYLFGGISNRGYNESIRVLDTATNKFTTLSVAGLTSSLHKLGACAVGTKVYLFGGLAGNVGDSVYMFNTADNSFSTLSAKLSMSARTVTTAAVGSNIYLFGGTFAQGFLNTIYVFNTGTNNLTELKSMTLPIATSEMAAAVVGNKIYLFGGSSSSGYSNRIYIFDTLNNTITTSTTKLPVAADGISCAVIGKKIYLFGGEAMVNGSITALSSINIFDTETQQITELNTKLPTGLTNIGSATLNSTTYLFGGWDCAYGYLSAVGTFNIIPSTVSTKTNTLLIEAGNNSNTFNLLPNINLGINTVYFDDSNGNRTKVPAALYKNGTWTEI